MSDDTANTGHIFRYEAGAQGVVDRGWTIGSVQDEPADADLIDPEMVKAIAAKLIAHGR